MSGFTHLHLHTCYSLNDGMIKPKQLAQKCRELGFSSVAITDHGVMYNMPEICQALENENIKPIIGMETYVAPRLKTLKEARIDNANYHLVLLSENNIGYKNLIKISSDAALNGMYYKARTDKATLKQHSEGLIALSACLGGEVQHYLLDGDYDEAKRVALQYRDIFGENNFFLEIQRHGLKEQDDINPLIIKLSNETGIKLVATNDCHYISKGDWEAHDVLMAIQAGTTIADKKRKVYTSHEFYVKSKEEMEELFSDLPDAIKNTGDIACRCNAKLEFGGNKLPKFNIPNWFEGDNADFLTKIAFDGSKTVYNEITDEIINRTNYEISVIKNMGYVDYFLITWDFFRFCREGTMNYGDEPLADWDPILTGPGRGSGAGSILLYELGITQINPLAYNLMFERFLDPSRISMPDIDSDFDDERRQEVIDYVVRKYGRKCVSQIITFGTLAARAVIRAVGRALDYPYSTCDKVAKMIPQKPGIKLKDALIQNTDLRKIYESDDKIHRLISLAMNLEGLPTSSGTHAAGVLITDLAGVEDNVPLWKNDSGIVSQYDKDWLEPLGLLKMDFLGLKTLGVINRAIKFIKKNHGVDINLNDLYKIPTLEPLRLIREGKTTGVFQLEGSGMTSFMKELKPDSIEDIIAGISMYRPGPMKEIPKFLYNKRNPNDIIYPIKGLDKILGPTYGTLTYQEQCMMAVVEIAGYHKSDSDGFRKVISKKKKKEIPLHRKWFIYGREENDLNADGEIIKYPHAIPGGIKMGHRKEDLEKFFDIMEDFGSYAFNKSHAAAYAFVGYLTAYFMCYYPAEFMASLLNSVKGNRVRVGRYINYCRQELGIEIIEPNINYSDIDFKPLAGNKIAFALSVKSTSESAITNLISERENNGIYKNMIDFIVRNRSTMDRSTMVSLISVGAFKDFNVNRSIWMAGITDLWDKAVKNTKNAEKNYEKKKIKTEPFVFKSALLERIKDIFPDIDEYPDEVILKMEKEYLGLYLTGNPLDKYLYSVKTISNFSTLDIEYDIDEETGAVNLTNKDIRNNQSIRFIGVLDEVNEIVTKKQTLMGICQLSDLNGYCKSLVWPNTYSNIKNKLIEGDVYIIDGYLKISDDDEPLVIMEDLNPIESSITDRVIVRLSCKNEITELLKYIKSNVLYQGTNPIYVKHNGMSVLLTKDFWVNPAYFNNECKFDSEIQTW